MTVKFALASDLHFAYGPVVLNNTENAKVLILAGDIYEADELSFTEEYNYVKTFFDQVSKEFDTVLWVAGNHEFYGTSVEVGISRIKSWLKFWGFDNVLFIEKESVEVEGVLFHGTTLWTDFKKLDPLVVSAVVRGTNDYTEIQQWTALAQYTEHNKSLSWLSDSIQPNRRNVVITHHQPCFLSIDPRFINDLTNYGYFTELSDFILDRPEIKFWCAGHTHRNLDYLIDDTRVICNPRGYNGHERRAQEFRLKYYVVE
jgi:predicted phosphodiesterase